MERPETEVHWLPRLAIWVMLALLAGFIALAVWLLTVRAEWWSPLQVLAVVGVWLVLTPARKAAARFIHAHLTAVTTAAFVAVAYWTCGGNDLPNQDSEPLTFDQCIAHLYSPDDQSSPVARGKRSLTSRIGSDADAEDIVHDTVINVCEETADRYVPDLPGYFGRSIENARIDLYRKVTRRESCPIGFNPTHFPVDTSVRWEWIDVQNAIQCTLSDEEAFLIALVAEGRKTAEIADILGVEPAAARQRLRRIRVKLKAGLKTDPETHGF